MSASVGESPCSFCRAMATAVGRQKVLGRYEVQYFQCPRCDLLFTERPYWLKEAYSHALSQLDTGAVQRNFDSARLSMLLAATLGLPATAEGLDYGAGHGVFVRMMRDLGLDFYWFDTHAENLYARGFEGDPARRYAFVTAFEVLEHFADVRGDLERLFGPRPDFVFVGTVLHEGYQPGWWYYLLESGQHVSFYSRRTMTAIAERFGYSAIIGPLHALFVREDVRLGAARRAIAQRVLGRPGIALGMASLVPARLLHTLTPYRSLSLSDYETLRRRVQA